MIHMETNNQLKNFEKYSRSCLDLRGNSFELIGLVLHVGIVKDFLQALSRVLEAYKMENCSELEKIDRVFNSTLVEYPYVYCTVLKTAKESLRGL